jgi:hypothetical protein
VLGSTSDFVTGLGGALALVLVVAVTRWLLVARRRLRRRQNLSAVVSSNNPLKRKGEKKKEEEEEEEGGGAGSGGGDAIEGGAAAAAASDGARMGSASIEGRNRGCSGSSIAASGSRKGSASAPAATAPWPAPAAPPSAPAAVVDEEACDGCPAYAGAPLPAGWEPRWSTSRAKYYFQHAHTHEKTWKLERAWARAAEAAGEANMLAWHVNPMRGRTPSVLSSNATATSGTSGRAAGSRSASVFSAGQSAEEGGEGEGGEGEGEGAPPVEPAPAPTPQPPSAEAAPAPAPAQLPPAEAAPEPTHLPPAETALAPSKAPSAPTAARLAPKEWAVLHAARQAGRLTVACDPFTGLPPGWVKMLHGSGVARFVDAATGKEVDSVDGVLRALGASVLQEVASAEKN